MGVRIVLNLPLVLKLLMDGFWFLDLIFLYLVFSLVLNVLINLIIVLNVLYLILSDFLKNAPVLMDFMMMDIPTNVKNVWKDVKPV